MHEMIAEVAASPEIYRPSRCWDHLNAVNAQWLEEFGLENFKRTVSQNYFNWLVVGRRDPQFATVRRLWRKHPTLGPLLTRMADPGLIRTTNGLESHFGWRARQVYRLFVGMLWQVAVREDRLGLTRRLEEPELGNPIPTRTISGRRISQDLANSIRECNAIVQSCLSGVERPVVAELGAGSGRLAHTFLAGTGARYFIFDIPPALHVSQWYLTRLFPERRVFAFRRFSTFQEVERELATSDVAFLTPNQMALFPDAYFDATVTISTLPEMRQEQIENYLAQFARLARRGVYVKQWRRWTNDADGYEFTYDRLVLPGAWRMVLDRQDSVQPHFQERAWTR